MECLSFRDDGLQGVLRSKYNCQSNCFFVQQRLAIVEAHNDGLIARTGCSIFSQGDGFVGVGCKCAGGTMSQECGAVRCIYAYGCCRSSLLTVVCYIYILYCSISSEGWRNSGEHGGLVVNTRHLSIAEGNAAIGL